ncbi:hypothetical protein WG66_014189 [Moniliophthora roreri]|uniref:Secreted protein n=1 Tax=Moniliophthora roreri TaxID=221103 RepID=A0A0W0FP68_MONRR|nr:hypothetical protein WG66_014189 [Moniliophthora roreri]
MQLIKSFILQTTVILICYRLTSTALTIPIEEVADIDEDIAKGPQPAAWLQSAADILDADD